MDLLKKERLTIAVLILFSAALFLPGLGKMALTDPDEVFYAETAREMRGQQSFLTPYIFGEPQFEKPPFYYWLVISGFRLFGVNEFSARLASAIFGILGVVGTYLLGKILINRRAGFLSGIILATSVKYTVLARACVTDIVLCVFILYAFLFFFHKRYLLSALSLGLAVLTKGPVFLFLPGLIIALYLFFAKELARLKEIPFVRCALLFLAVAAPWYILMYAAHGREFIDVFFGFHNIIRFLEPEHRLGDVFYYYIPILLGGFFPWSVFLPLGIWRFFGEKEEKTRKINLFLILWILVILAFFSISRTKLPTYIFPLYPALALLMGRASDGFLGNNFTAAQKKFLGFSACSLFILLIGGMPALNIIAKTKYPTVVNAALMTGAAFIMLMGVSVFAMWRRKYVLGAGIYMASFIIFIFLLSYFIFPEIGKYESSEHVSKRLLALAKPHEEIAAETQYRRGVAFYTRREGIPDVHRHHILTKFLKKPRRVWCVLKEKNYNQLYDDEKKPYDKATYIVYQLGKKVIVTNEMPPGGKFLKMRDKNVSR
jgi:4-amino-4-deoxy-L-arabinose transferase-like glycosyltransferase